MRKLKTLGALLVISTVGACQITPKQATLPDSVQIREPADTVPSQYTAFSGIWSGDWDGVLSSKLAVEKIEPDGAVSAVYAWGDYPGRFGAGSSEREGQINDNVLTLERFESGAIVKFEMREDGRLDATYDPRVGDDSEAVFSKE